MKDKAPYYIAQETLLYYIYSLYSSNYKKISVPKKRTLDTKKNDYNFKLNIQLPD